MEVWSKGQYIRLETIGRKTGRPHSVIVRYITLNGNIIVFPENSGSQDWVLNILKNPFVKVYSEYGIFECQAKYKSVQNLSDPLLSIFTRKYGTTIVRSRYWGQTRYVELTPTRKTLGPSYEQLFYDDIEAAFDTIAEEYDQHIFGNPVNSWLRSVSVGLLTQLFKPGDTVLEIGCGTGTETISLLKKGINIIASDISVRMLDVLARKAKELGVSGRLKVVHARASQVVEKLLEAGCTQIDGVYSNYGAVNTEPKLKELVGKLHTIIRPGGILELGVWNKYCAIEILGYTIRMRPSMAVARFKSPVPIGKSRFCVSSWAYSVGELEQILKPYFTLERVQGVVIAIPPSNLTRYLPPKPWFDTLKKLDINLGRIYPVNRLGDHYLAVFRRR
ncbi:MAG: nitroreductase/quinone reductase family protein [Thermoprotei archaeon]